MLYWDLKLSKKRNPNYIRHISDLLEDVRVTNIPGFYNVRLDSWIFKSFLQI